jgi:hypothetical protein
MPDRKIMLLTNPWLEFWGKYDDSRESRKALRWEEFEWFTGEGIVLPAEKSNEKSLAPRQLYQTLFAIPQVRGTLFPFVLLSYKIHSTAYFSTQFRCCLLCCHPHPPLERDVESTVVVNFLPHRLCRKSQVYNLDALQLMRDPKYWTWTESVDGVEYSYIGILAPPFMRALSPIGALVFCRPIRPQIFFEFYLPRQLQ